MSLNTAIKLSEIASKSFMAKDYARSIQAYKKIIELYPGLGEVLQEKISFIERHIGKEEPSTLLASQGLLQGLDPFMLRGIKPESNNAIVLNIRLKSISEDIKNILRYINSEKIDLYVLASEDILPCLVEYIPNRIVHLGAPDAENSAVNFFKAASTGIFLQYKYLTLANLGNESIFGKKNASAEKCLKINHKEFGIYSEETISWDPQECPEAFSNLLKTCLIRLGISPEIYPIKIPNSEFVTFNTILLQSLSTCIKTAEIEGALCSSSLKLIYCLMSILSNKSDFTSFSLKNDSSLFSEEATLKAIAFYLPQFHPVDENDKWWGNGFTEWRNVVRGKPLFRYHYQPRQPADFGFYDLRIKDNQIRQADLASKFGIHGFCFYYYWFNGKKMLNHPVEQFFNNKEINTNFCVCWANENWSRNWDGQNRHVLLEQNYSLDENINLMRELIPYMKDSRWIRYKGKPVFVVYRISIIPNWAETALAWREVCRRAGLGEIHLCAVRFGLENLEGEPKDHGVDSYVLFPPHEAARKDLKNDVVDLHKDFNGEIFDYESVIEGDIKRFSNGYKWPVHRGAMLGWDNTARRLTSSRIFHGATPYGFRRWVKGIIEQELKFNKCDEKMLFINAWNEWAEGTYLEPDQKWSNAYLRSFQSAAQEFPSLKLCSRSSSSALYKSLGSISLDLDDLEKNSHSLNRITVFNGKKVLNKDYPTFLVCAHVSGHQLFGGERSLLDVVRGLEKLKVNIIITLPSANNSEYIELLRQVSSKIYCFKYPQWKNKSQERMWITNIFSSIILREEVDIVYANTIVIREPLYAAKRHNRVSIVHVRELISVDESLKAMIGFNGEEIVRKVFEYSDYAICNSNSTYNLFYRPTQSFYVPNAIDHDKFEMSNKFGNKITFGIISSNILKKGILDFAEIAKKCSVSAPRANFLIIGPKNTITNSLEKEIREGLRPNNLAFTGYISNPRSAISKCNVVFSLSSFAESFGRTVAEAMAASRPVIGYAWGALPDLIKHELTGILLPYRDIQSGVKAVMKLCNNDALIHEYGENGKNHIDKYFSQDVLSSKLDVAVTSILDKEARREKVASNSLRHKVNVIVTIFNAASEVQNCIKSIERNTNFDIAHIILVNDASTDPEINNILSKYVSDKNFTVINNKVNQGYTKSVNIGISCSDTADVVLLNSDTIVTPCWLEGLISTAYTKRNIGTVTAMSDNAGAFSFPYQGKNCTKPANLGYEFYSLLITSFTGKVDPPEVATGSGFCFYIRRELLNIIGLFDENLFKRGYGEENDFCMRAAKAGWKNVISPHAFVYHIRTASFKGEKQKLVQEGVDKVTSKYPEYASLVKKSFNSEPMKILREAAHHAVVAIKNN